MVNLVVIAVGFSHCLSVTVPNQRAAANFSLSDGGRMGSMRPDAGVAQLVEHELPKLGVAGSNPVARSSFHPAPVFTRGFYVKQHS